MHSLVVRQLRKCFGADAVLSPEQRKFAEAVADAYTAADEDRHRLEHSLGVASLELTERNTELEQQVVALTRFEAYIDRRNRDMTLILDHVAQGFVTIDLDGRLANECSAALTRWFGEVGECMVWSYLFTEPELAEWMMLGLASLRSNLIPADLVIAQLPARFERDGRQFRIEYLAIGAPTTSLLVVVTDITDEVARLHTERMQSELIAVIEQAGGDRDGVRDFIAQTDPLVAACYARDVPLDVMRRRIHTLKGNTSLVGMTHITDLCHAVETRITDDGTFPEPSAIAAIGAVWTAFRERAAQLLDLDRDLVVVDRAEFRRTVAELGDEPAAQRVRRWGLDSTRKHLERLAEQARQLADRLEKPQVEIEIADRGIYVERERFAPLWSALAHVIRNAVDHGIEAADVRIAAGKPETARIALRTEVRESELVVEVEDDGPGIDWRGVTARARALGLSCEGHEALFASGVSTAHELTDVSGRGVGMGALRETCLQLGGRVELATEHGRGTAFRCVIPLRVTNSASSLPAQATSR